MTNARTGLMIAAATSVLLWNTAAAQELEAPAEPEAADVVAEPYELPAEEPLAGSPADEAPPPAPDPAPPPPAAPTLPEAIAGGKLLLEERVRYEAVDQANFADQAEAFTARTRLGWETADWHGLKALMEFEDVRQLGGEDYNTTVNGKTAFPVIGDPDVTALDRLQLAWTPNATFSTTLGRQRIILDDQRFVGNVGWRQDEQTFDALRVDGTFGKLKTTYAYVGQINRVFAERLDWDSDSHLFQAVYSVSEPLKLQGFVYALDFEQSAANSTLTTGGKATGSVWAGLVKVVYGATYASQSDYGRNPGSFTLDYWEADAAAVFDIYTAKVAWESLEGDGVRGFATPLATLHAWQGWADVFLTTPANGIDDLNFTLNAKPRWKWTYLFNLDLTARFHDFTAQRTGADLGEEWNAQLTAAFNPKLSGLVKYADYDGVAGFPSRTKLWIGLEYKL